MWRLTNLWLCDDRLQVWQLSLQHHSLKPGNILVIFWSENIFPGDADYNMVSFATILAFKWSWIRMRIKERRLTVCWKFELLGSQEMTADVEVMLEALTHDGPRGASLPMIMVQAASRDVLLLMVTERTLMRWGFVLSTPSTRARVLSEARTVVLRNPST